MLVRCRWHLDRHYASLRALLSLTGGPFNFDSAVLRTSFSTTGRQKTGLSDPDVEASFLKRFREVQKRPDAAEVAHLIWFLASESEDLNTDSVFVELCDFAATRARSFSPTEIELIFNVCFKKLQIPHPALLQSVAEALMESGDLSSFPSASIAQILSYISRRHRLESRQLRDEFVPRQKAFTELLMEEATGKDRLERLSATYLADIFCSGAFLGGRDTPCMERLKKQILKRDVLRSLTAKEVAHVAYAAAHLQHKEPALLMAMAQIFPQRATQPDDILYLGVILISLVRQSCVIHVPTSVVEFGERVTSDQIASLRNEDLACWLYSLGKLSLPHPHLLKLLSNEIQKRERLQTMKGQQILSVLQAVQDLEWKEGRPLVEALSHEVLAGKDSDSGQSKISQFNVLELCGILHSWSRMKAHKDWGLQALLHEVIKPTRRGDLTDVNVALMVHCMGLSGLYDEPTMQFLQQEWLHTKKLKGFGDQSLTMLLNGLSKLPRHKGLTAAKLVMREMTQKKRLHRSDSVRLTSLLHSAAAMKLNASAEIQALLKEATKLERLESMSERCLALIVYSVGKLSYLETTRNTTCKRFVHEALKPQRLKQMDNQALSNLLLGLGQSRYWESSEVLRFAWELLEPHRAHDLSQRGCIQLVHLVCVLAKLRIRNRHQILAVVSKRILEKGVRSFTPLGIVLLVTRLEKLNFRDIHIYSALVGEALRQGQLGQLNAEDLPMIMESIARLGYTPIFRDLVRLGLKDLEEIQRYTLSDLRRLLRALASMKQIKRPELIKRLEQRISALTTMKPLGVLSSL